MKKVIIGILGTSEYMKTNDAFYDVYKYSNNYIKKIVENDAVPLLIPLVDDKLIEETLDMCDGLLLPGGSYIKEVNFKVIDYFYQRKKPILGICMGMQTLAMYSVNIENKERKRIIKPIDTGVDHWPIEVIRKNLTTLAHKDYVNEDSLLYKILYRKEIIVNSLHHNTITEVGSSFKVVAHSEDNLIEAIEYNGNDRFVLGVQFHPEVNHTENGTAMIRNFLYRICGAVGDWTMEDYMHRCIEEIRSKVGYGQVLLALSGGVDSSVCAALFAEAIGAQLTCVFVDHGLLRKDEGDEVEEAFKKWDINLIRVNAGERFLGKLAGVTEPEQKRKIIGEEFIRVFEEEGKKIGRTDFLAQGTIYPDVIESGKENAETIKSHHNVGGLPDFVDFKEIIEPLRLLFKDEVRELGRQLGLPEYMVMRQPFPGPGLAIRVIGEITEEKLAILREADFIFREEVARAKLDTQMNQYFAVLTNMKSVGVMGDGRTYDWAIALRSVTTEDFMTADWSRIPYEVLDKVSSRIVNEVPHVNRILYDITSKPPSTVEFE